MSTNVPPDAVATVALLARHLGGEASEIELLVDVPHERRVLACRIGATRVVVKTWATAGAFDVAPLIALHGATTTATHVAVPLVLHHDSQTVALTWMAGTPLSAMLAGDDPGLTGAAHRCGLALRELHAVDPAAIGLVRPASIEHHLAELVRPEPRALATAYPPARRVVERALDHLLDTEPPPGATAVAVLHRDFHARQLLVADERIGVIDWDLIAAGDPAFDVGYLTTYLETHGARPDVSAAFLDGYGDPTMPGRIGRYRCFNLLRRACRRLRVRDAGWQEEMRRMVGLLDAALDDAAGADAEHR